MQTTIRSMNMLEWAMLLLLSILWGGSFFFVGVAVDTLTPLTIVALRVSLAAMALLAFLFLRGVSLPRTGHIWLAFYTMGVLNNVIPFTLIVWGQGHIASGLASILNATTPLFTVICAHFMTRDEKLTRMRFAGICTGLAGVTIMIGHEALGGLGTDVFAQLAVLGAAVSYSIAAIFGRRFKRLGIDPMVTATGQVSASASLLIPLALLFEQPWHLESPGWETWGAIVGLALLSTALAYVLYFRILSTAGATNVLLVTLLIPVSAIVLGATILGEQLAVQHYIGMGLISCGLICIDGRLLQRRPRKISPSQAPRPSTAGK